MNLAVGRSYRDAMSGFAQMRTLDISYARADAHDFRKEWDAGATKAERSGLKRSLAKSRAKDSMKAFDKLTQLVDGERRIVSDPPLIVPINDLLSPDQAQAFSNTLRVIIRSYRRTMPADRRLLVERFRYVDCARKVVGVGSVGTRAWVVLMVGNDGDDPLFLQLKEADPSVLEAFLGKSKFATHGQRVVEGQRLMQSASDIMLGWIRHPGIDGVTRDFYIRQLWDGKGSANVETMSPRGLKVYARMCRTRRRGARPRPSSRRAAAPRSTPRPRGPFKGVTRTVTGTPDPTRAPVCPEHPEGSTTTAGTHRSPQPANGRDGCPDSRRPIGPAGRDTGDETSTECSVGRGRPGDRAARQPLQLETRDPQLPAQAHDRQARRAVGGQEPAGQVVRRGPPDPQHRRRLLHPQEVRRGRRSRLLW